MNKTQQHLTNRFHAPLNYKISLLTAIMRCLTNKACLIRGASLHLLRSEQWGRVTSQQDRDQVLPDVYSHKFLDSVYWHKPAVSLYI